MKVDFKIPPHNIEAEFSILASCLLYPDDCLEFSSLLSPEDFYRTAHQKIFESILDLTNENIPVNAQTVKEKLVQGNELEKAGGAEFLAKILEEPIAPNVKHYADTLRGYKIRRQLIETANAIFKNAHRTDLAPEEILNKAQKLVLGVEYNKNGSQSHPLKELILESQDRYEALHQGNCDVTGVPSGFIDLDAATCGLQKSNLIIIAARPSQGKTALALNIARNAAYKNIGSVIFSLEMSREQITDRLVSIDSGVNLLKFQSGRFLNEDWIKIIEAQHKLYNLPFEIDDTPGLHYNEIRRRARKLKKQRGVGLIFIDYIGLCQGDHENGRVQEISSISRNFKAMAKELNIPVVALSQLNRSLENRPNKMPRISDLRESGALEQDADLVAFIYRDEVYDLNSKRKGIADINIAKHRNGPIGIIGLKWEETTTTFLNLAKKQTEKQNRSKD